MHRVDGPGNVGGHWVAEDPLNARPGTEITPDIMEALQEEIVSVITARGKPLDKTNNHQLLDCILEITSGADIIARFTTTADVLLTGLGVQAGGDWASAMHDGDIVLVKNQIIPQDNGPYVAGNGTWSRVSYFDSSIEITPGKLIKVTEGATLADTIWMLTTDAPIVLNSSALNFSRKDGNQIIKATTAQAVAGSNDTAFMTALKSLQLIQAVFNVSDSAPLFACRGWVKFNGTTILGGGNVSSITSLGGGFWRVNYITALPHTNYACHVSAVDSGASGTTIGNPSSYATNYVDIRLTVSSFDNAGADSSSSVSVSVFC